MTVTNSVPARRRWVACLLTAVTPLFAGCVYIEKFVFIEPELSIGEQRKTGTIKPVATSQPAPAETMNDVLDRLREGKR